MKTGLVWFKNDLRLHDNEALTKAIEEYVRRQNLVSLDNAPVLTFTLGGISCEPYRMYNTQGNGIYGTSVKTTAWRTAWNNWCPGNSVPIRSFTSASLTAGNHVLKYKVPTAVFYGQDERIVLSMYLQSNNQLLAVNEVSSIDVSIFPNPTSDYVNIKSDKKVKNIVVYALDGRKLSEVKDARVDLSSYSSGTYLLDITMEGGTQFKHKIIKR
ncbi:MAG: C-terminal target protein [Chryseobacterium sp.]|jgi:hypothetical protein|nr:C-terminal target protein [Chryseobacterium sp.]